MTPARAFRLRILSCRSFTWNSPSRLVGVAHRAPNRRDAVGMGMVSAKTAQPSRRPFRAVAAAAGGWMIAPTRGVGIAVGLFVMLGAGVVEASECGGSRECVCGDKVVEDYELP